MLWMCLLPSMKGELWLTSTWSPVGRLSSSEWAEFVINHHHNSRYVWSCVYLFIMTITSLISVNRAIRVEINWSSLLMFDWVLFLQCPVRSPLFLYCNVGYNKSTLDIHSHIPHWKFCNNKKQSFYALSRQLTVEFFKSMNSFQPCD